ncbi:PREDICTED: probable ATP-dependent RNA helicase DDX27 [Priapulus caudatus]|uniref:RNA helicase n=1 Tax=Priapulus caudatus TaxID=37621 RepID=A0ABM1DQ57_PRICU|nr:PREDICTED: probable ATP-dependent RNA helicase DDX27 [Priapulus caudatus]
MAMRSESDFGFVGTITDDVDVPLASESSDNEDEVLPHRKTKKRKNKHSDFSTDFVFNEKSSAGDLLEKEYGQVFKQRASATSLDEKIAKIRRQKKKEQKSEQSRSEKENEEMGAEQTNNSVPPGEDEESNQEAEESDQLESSDSELDEKPDTLKMKQRKGKQPVEEQPQQTIEYDSEDELEKQRFFEDAPPLDNTSSFQEMNLSRPLMKAISALNFVLPTPIQAATIPVALLGKDICACAATGTGKTAAFMLPILERLLFKPKQAPVTRVLVMTPTRELAVQIFQVSRQLAQYTNVTICLAAGGLDVRSQEAALRLGPDVVIATPGRLIDHLQNTPCFHLSSIEVLILDEADRMLDEYFAQQMKEIIKECAVMRQTMLFSATMSDQVKDLATVSLKKPVKIFVDSNRDVAFGLRQEFLRIRANREGDREAILAALVSRTFHDHCMVFVQTKKQAHRLHVALGLLGCTVGELHGNMSQPQRLDALARFKEAQLDVLVATDLAARGLDIAGVKTVINFTMPNTVQHYIHRVGRTARAGKSGRAVSMVGESERKMLKEIVKRARTPVKSRVVPQEVINKYMRRLAAVESDIGQVLRMETEEKEIKGTEAQVHKAEKLINQKQEVGRPKRTWFQTHRERMEEQERVRLGEYNKMTAKKKKLSKEELANMRKKLTPEERVELQLRKTMEYQARIMKRDRRPKRIISAAEATIDDLSSKKSKIGKKKKKPGEQKGSEQKSAFHQDLTNVSKKSVSKLRAGPSYNEKKEAGMLKKKTGPKGTFKSKSRYKRR